MRSTLKDTAGKRREGQRKGPLGGTTEQQKTDCVCFSGGGGRPRIRQEVTDRESSRGPGPFILYTKGQEEKRSLYPSSGDTGKGGILFSPLAFLPELQLGRGEKLIGEAKGKRQHLDEERTAVTRDHVATERGEIRDSCDDG